MTGACFFKKQMGYTHYWYRPLKIEAGTFQRIIDDFRRIMPALQQYGVKLAGPLGTGKPKINLDIVSFNGPEKCGHPVDHLLGIAWPHEKAAGVMLDADPVIDQWFGGGVLTTRACGGSCSHETFHFPRVYDACDWEKPNAEGIYFNFCKTAFKPYDLAVTAFLIIAKHHLKNKIKVSSDGQDQHWFDAKMLCMMELGYGFGYVINNDGYLDRKDLAA